MSSYIQNLLECTLGDGARSAHFGVEIHWANPAVANPDVVSTLCKSVQVPNKTHEKIDLMYKGRPIPIKGQTKYSQTWTATFYLPQDHKLRHWFEEWVEAMDQKHNYNQHLSSNVVDSQNWHNAVKYTGQIKVYQTSFEQDQLTAEYTLYNAFPTEVSELEYSADNVGSIQEFTVTFAYSHYDTATTKGNAGNFVDQLAAQARTATQNAVDKVKERIGDIGGLF